MKTILITGASSGFGYEMVKIFSKQNYRIIAIARREDRLRQLANQIGQNIHTITLDISDKNAINQALNDLPKDYENIDILVNNAGFALGLDKFHEADMRDFEKMIDTNIKGTIYMTKALINNLIKTKGYIINLGSIAGTYAYMGGNIYGATKAFVRQFSLNLRADLRNTGVRVTNIEPGICETDFSLVRFKGDKKRADAVYKDHHAIQAIDIANLIFMCVNQPSHVNINTLEVMATTQSFAGLIMDDI